MTLRRAKPCQYGVFSVRCGQPSVARRRTPAGRALWDVCERHLTFLDRLEANMTKHKPLLDRLRDG